MTAGTDTEDDNVKYDFDKKVNRRGTDSMKWDVAENELPMWVADMDFQTAPEIREAFAKRLEHGVFGYANVTQEWYDAVCGWWQDRHHFSMEQEWLIFCTGVVPAISSIVRKVTTVGENVLVQTPVYNIFFNSIVNNGRHILESPLQYENGIYSIDFADLEEKLSNPQTTLMILCNPHNPVGKIWDRETLEKIGELCWKHHVIVLSDEIHCDITAPSKEYIPFASVSEHCRENSITCIAPTKAFNLAGLQSSAVVVPNEVLRHKVNRGLNTDEVAEPNSFAVTAAVAAFTNGGSWLDELKEYLWKNREFAKSYIEKEIPDMKLVDGEATYLLWLDCSKIVEKSAKCGEGCGKAAEQEADAGKLCKFLREKTGLYVSAGSSYGRTGANFLRMNIACPRATLEDGLNRLKTGIAAFCL